MNVEDDPLIGLKEDLRRVDRAVAERDPRALEEAGVSRGASERVLRDLLPPDERRSREILDTISSRRDRRPVWLMRAPMIAGLAAAAAAIIFAIRLGGADTTPLPEHAVRRVLALPQGTSGAWMNDPAPCRSAGEAEPPRGARPVFCIERLEGEYVPFEARAIIKEQGRYREHAFAEDRDGIVAIENLPAAASELFVAVGRRGRVPPLTELEPMLRGEQEARAQILRVDLSE